MKRGGAVQAAAAEEEFEEFDDDEEEGEEEELDEPEEEAGDEGDEGDGGDEDPAEEESAEEEPEKAALKAPPKKRPKPPAKKKAQSRAQPEEEDRPIRDEPPWGGGPPPIEGVQVKDDSFVRVERVEVSDHPDSDPYTGYCGMVRHRWGFEKLVRQKWGGGKFRLVTWVNGKQVVRSLEIEGIPSKAVDPPEKEEGDYDDYGWIYEEDPEVAEAYRRGFPRGSSRVPGAAPWRGTRRQDRDYDQGYRDWPGHEPAISSARRGGGPWNPAQSLGDSLEVKRDEQIKDLVQQLSLEREQRRVEKAKHEFNEKDLERKQEIDSLRAAIQQKDAGGSNVVQDMLTLQAEQWKQRQDQEREEQRRRWDQEMADRKEAREREERRLREEREREDKRREEERAKKDEDYRRREEERKDRLEKEDRERRDREEARIDDRRRQELESKRQKEFMDRMLDVVKSGQQSPTDMVSMLASLKQLSGGDMTEGVIKIAEAMSVIKQVATDGGEETGLDKASRFVSGVAEAITPAIGEIRNAWGRQPDQAAPAQQPAAQIPYHQEAQPQALPAPQATQPQEGNVMQTGLGPVTPQQWGKVLTFVVDAHDGQDGPADVEETTTHLLTTIKAIDALGALEALAATDVDQLHRRLAVLYPMVAAAGAEAAPKIRRLGEVIRTPAGRTWVHALLQRVRHYYVLLTQTVRQRQGGQPPQAPPPAPQQPQPAAAPPPPPDSSQEGPELPEEE